MLKIGGIYKEVNAFDKIERYFIVLKKINRFLQYDWNIFTKNIYNEEMKQNFKVKKDI